MASASPSVASAVAAAISSAPAAVATNSMGLSPAAASKILVNEITQVFCIVSIGVSFLVIVACILLRVYKPEIGKKTSVRLSGWISFADILVTSTQILYIHGNVIATFPNIAVGFVLSTLQSSSLWFVYLTVCVTVDLHLTVLAPKYAHIADKLDPWLVPVSFVWAILTTIPLHFISPYWDIPTGTFGKQPTYIWKPYMWLSQYVWTILGIVYCFIVVMLVIIKLIRLDRQKQSSLHTHSTQEEVRVRNRMRKVMIRLVFYPVVPIVTQTWLIVMNSLLATDPSFITIVNINNIANSLQGLLNGIVFTINPAVYGAWKKWRKEMRSLNETTMKDLGNGSSTELSTWYSMQKNRDNEKVDQPMVISVRMINEEKHQRF